MNKKEAIQAMLDGKKVKHEQCSNVYIYNTVSAEFSTIHGDSANVNVFRLNDWELYQEPPKTESWAKFRVWSIPYKQWMDITAMYKSLEHFKADRKAYIGEYSHHHEIEGSRVDLPVVVD